MLVPLVLVVAAAAGVALLTFEPWTLLTEQVVDEALPTGTAPVTGPGPSQVAPTSPTGSPTGAPAVLARGSFISHEHPTSGTARVLQLADGTRVLRIEGLDTSNGPDLHVWLTDAPVLEGRQGWTVFDDGAYVELGALKGNRGNQNYVLPGEVDLSVLTSVTIWCKRFHVSFGAAQLA